MFDFFILSHSLHHSLISTLFQTQVSSLAAFLSQHPQVDIDLEEHSSREIVRAVAGNLAEIGIVGDEVNPAKELQTFPFAEDRLVLIAPRVHVVCSRRTIAFRDTLAYDHVGLPSGNALQDQLEDHAARAGRHLKLRVRLPGFDAVHIDTRAARAWLRGFTES